MKLLTFVTRYKPVGEAGGWRVAGEEQLVAAARQGDRRAFDTLVAAHLGPLRGFLGKRVQASVLEDVIQEALVGAWTGLPRFRPEVSFKAWLYRIALNKAADRNRADARRAVQERPLDGGEDIWPSGDDVIAAAERRHIVAALLDDLTDPQREILEMYYYADLSLAEIASLLGRNLNTVKYQFYRAHEAAARLLGETVQRGRRSLPQVHPDPRAVAEVTSAEV